jgi:hypothetical protein
MQQHLQNQLIDNLPHLRQNLSSVPRKSIQNGFVTEIAHNNTETINKTKDSEAKNGETSQSKIDSSFVPAVSPSKIKNKWYLGILSQKLPKEIMQEVFRVLRLLQFVHTNTLSHSLTLSFSNKQKNKQTNKQTNRRTDKQCSQFTLNFSLDSCLGMETHRTLSTSLSSFQSEERWEQTTCQNFYSTFHH